MVFYSDIHSHIMPGVDDGALDISESIAMLSAAQKEHIGQIILTPHQKPDRRCVTVEGIHRRIAQLKEELDRQQIGIKLYPGSELFFHHELKEKLKAQEVSTLAGSHYAMIEFLPQESWNYIRDGLYGLSCAGYLPVVAHAERCENLMKELDRVQELIDMGCYIQVNTGSLTGDFGFGVKRRTAALVKNKMVHFLGTDAHHGTGKRVPAMEKCAAWFYKKAGTEYAEQLLWKNAEAIFADDEL